MNTSENFQNLNDFNEIKDTLLNKTAFDLFSYSILGFVSGLGISLFFKQKARICFVGAGFGAGISYEKNNGDLIKNQLRWQESHKI